MERLKEKICAVVVTYNRKDLLQECLEALLNQTYQLDSIIIVNNASTDGTEEMLKEKYLSNKIFDYFNTGENIGGAGGFHEGMKRAYEKGFDWIWVMDDDGKPDLECLYKILEQKINDDSNYRPLIITTNKELTWGFPLYINNNEIKIRELSQISVLKEKVYQTWGVGLLGGLYSRKVIGKYGLPEKKIFIRGDDDEYNQRLFINNVKSYFIKEAIFYHPKELSTYIKFLNYEIKYYENNFPLFKIYFEIRNHIYFMKKYIKYPYIKIFRLIIRETILTFLKPSYNFYFLNKIKVIYLAIIHGIFNKFNNKEMLNYLNNLKK